ncbi:thioesterase [Halobacteriales archaeon QH_7_66_37]|nr:MAG: thioesterase [Halobacteriales archaeon QH_7_66_37]
MDAKAFFEGMPFAQHLGVEVTECENGHAEGTLEMREELSWNENQLMAHGGVTFTLADTVGGAALVSVVDQPVPTIDMRIDYLSAATGDLYAEADVVRCGDDVGTVDVEVFAAEDDTLLADARGVYKTG